MNVGGGGALLVVIVLAWQNARDIGPLTATDLRAGLLAFVGITLFAVAGYRLQSKLDDYEIPSLRILKASDFDEWRRDIPGLEGIEIATRRIALIQVETTGGDATQVRLNLLRFTPQGRSGTIFLRERFDESPYRQSSIDGYRVQKGAPVLYDLCSLQNVELQATFGEGDAVIAIHYAVRPGLEPNPIRIDDDNGKRVRYFFEVQALGDGSKSEPTTFFAEVDANGELQTGLAKWPITQDAR